MNGAASSRSSAALLRRGPETGNRRWAGEQGSRGGRRSQAKLWVAVGIAQCSKRTPYSITSSARAISVGRISIPRAFAVFRLMTNSNVVGN